MVVQQPYQDALTIHQEETSSDEGLKHRVPKLHSSHGKRQQPDRNQREEAPEFSTQTKPTYRTETNNTKQRTKTLGVGGILL